MRIDKKAKAEKVWIIKSFAHFPNLTSENIKNRINTYYCEADGPAIALEKIIGSIPYKTLVKNSKGGHLYEVYANFDSILENKDYNRKEDGCVINVDEEVETFIVEIEKIYFLVKEAPKKSKIKRVRPVPAKV